MGINLEDLAREAMLEKGLFPDYPASALRELEKIERPASPQRGMQDKRSLLWVSIDNIDSRDLDQVTYAETLSNGKDRIYIAVADVDALVPNNSALDLSARHNTTSVYTPGKVFAMLPPKLSTNLTSLNPHEERCAMVVELEVDQTGRFEFLSVYPALIENKSKLVYEHVADWLENGRHMQHVSEEVHRQLTLQNDIAERLHAFRSREGALGLDTIELQAVMIAKIAIRVEPRQVNRAHRLIENFMIAANVGITRFLKQSQRPLLQRVVRTPKRWRRIVILAKALGEILPPKPDVRALRDFLESQKQKRPEHFHDLSLSVIKLIGKGEYVVQMPGRRPIGHFDLALHDYAHTTAPNRRYPDLIMQRLLKSYIYETPPPYKPRQLVALAAHCTKQEDAATKVERRLIKCAAALSMQDQIGKRFPALITGAGRKGIWVRLIDPPIEGKVVQGCGKLDVGDQIQVQLLRVNVRKGFIDFKGCV